MTTTVRMLLAAAVLMLLAGVILPFCACGFTRPCWVRAHWAAQQRR